MSQSRFEKALYWSLLIKQIHSTLYGSVSQYALWSDKIYKNVKDKAGLKLSLWDDIKKFIGSDEIQWNKLEVFSKDQNTIFEAFLHNNSLNLNS